jgi:hypothetical protein
MPSRTLWRIPDPEDAARRALATHEVLERQRKARADTLAQRRARAREDAARIRQAETEKRVRERDEWRAAHPAPSREDLARLLDEMADDPRFPNLRCLKGKVDP